MKKTFLTALATGLFMVVMASAANATYMGYLYDSVAVGSGSAAEADAILENLANGTSVPILDSTFTVEAINFDSQRLAGSNTYTQFFQGGAANINGLTPLSALGGNFISTGSTMAAMVKITGEAYFDSTFYITHDDGVMIKVGNAWLDSSYPTSPLTSQFNVTAGVYSFELYYQAWNGNPEVLTTRGMNAVPEPTTMLLFGAGLAGLAAVGRRRRD